tara:strand:- start:9 stop:608 length:600 start_codon:yes stop_codon:yes gene_type:complete
VRLEESKRDFYRKKAKREGLRSRAAYKLIQIDKKYRIFNEGQIIIDVGCAPGGWLQFASNKVGSKGLVLGIDIQEVVPEPNSKIIMADIREENIVKKILEQIPTKADVVLSDMSPNLSGIWELDQEKQIDLTLRVVEMFPEILKNNGTAIMKVFQGKVFDEFLVKMRKQFKNVKLVKPEASRIQSSEIYLLCRKKLSIK